MDIGAEIADLLHGPRFPDREFVLGGATFGEVYAMAGSLLDMLAATADQGKPVCLATTDKAVLAAALLASLVGGPILLLPYAFSAPALERLRRLSSFTTAIADSGRNLPEGTVVIRPSKGGSANRLPDIGTRVKFEFLKIFTGGTTGSPQVWSKTGENIIGEGLFLARHFRITEQDRIVATVPPYHIYGLLFSVLLPLASGATVAAAIPSFPAEIAGAVQEHRATVLVSIPAHFRSLRERSMGEAPLRLAFSSAGMLEAEDNEAFFNLNRVGIAEVYGSTETGGIATRNRFRGESCFTPFPIVSWKIREQCICVRSPFLSPDLPREKDKYFITGDRVEACGENGFALLGRVDGVTKVGGKRVDLEEVRALIKKEPGVVDCVVMALPVPGGRESRIIALVQGTTVDIELIRQKLAGSLEPSALPRAIKSIEKIPMLDNGKYDRDAIIDLFAA